MTCPNCGKILEEPIPETCLYCKKPLTGNPVDEAVEKITTPITKNRFFLAGIIIFIFVITAIFVIIAFKNNGSPNNIPVEITPTPIQNPNIHDYNLDSNNNGIPDFVETATGYDPLKDQCKLNFNCGGIDPEYALKNTVNILIILDSSGSMNEKAGTQKKIDAAKEALSRYISTLGANTNVALLVYGHKGSNSQRDKQLSCSAIDLVYPFAKADSQKFLESANTFQPNGWTPIGGALQKAKEVFTGKEGQKNYILLISDGLETCGTNPLETAKELAGLPIKPQIDVIGFDIDTEAKPQLEEISKIGSGNFYNAQTSEEFKKIVINWWESWKKNYESFLCKDEAINTYLTCFAGRYQGAITYLTNLQLSLSINQEVRGVKATKEDTVQKIQTAKNNATLKNNQENIKWKETYDAIRREYSQNLELLGTPSP